MLCYIMLYYIMLCYIGYEAADPVARFRAGLDLTCPIRQCWLRGEPRTPDLPTKILPTEIRRIKHPGDSLWT